MPSLRPRPRAARHLPLAAARAAHVAALVVALVACVLVALTVGLTAGAGGAGAQGPTSSTTRPTSSSSSSSAPPSTTAVATTAAPSTASTPAPTTTVVATTTAPTSTTTVGTSSTLPPPPPVENARFPARLVAPVPPVEGEPELVVNAMYLAASEDAQAPDVVVHFRAPFALPASRYQVSVLVGDPNGQRARVSFISSGAASGQSGSKPTGTVEIGDGTTWTTSGPTPVQHDPSGFVVLRVPLAATPAGGAVWAEITQGTAAAPIVRTPLFDRTAFFGTADAGTLPASRFGRVNLPDGQAALDIAALDAGPVVTVHEQKIYVKYNEAPPTALLGQPVQEAVDLVRIVPNFDTGGVVGDYIRINRTDGTVGLFDGFGATPVDKSGDRGWVVRGPDGPPGPTTMIFDLGAAAEALGITLAADRTAVGLTRSFVLADGRIVTADGVVATNAWLDLAPPPLSAGSAATAPPPAAAAGTDERNRRIAAAAAAGLVLVLVLGAVLLRRRRRRKEDEAVSAAMASRAVAGDRIPWAKNDSQLTQELDRVVVPGTAEHSLLPVSGEVAAVSASSVGVAVIGAAAPPTGPGTPPEAEPPPSVGHAGPVPWRSSRGGPDGGGTAEVEPEPATADAPSGEHPAAEPPVAEALASDAVAAEARSPQVPAPEAPTQGTAPRAAVKAASALPAAAGDRRRRRASGVVIAGPTVGDVVGPATSGSNVVWAAEPHEPVEPPEPPEPSQAPQAAQPANREREVSVDPDQIDPNDALAALDLDLGSFRSRFDPEDP